MIDDKKSRELITDSLDKNYFVEASAGSGKTTSLVNRMVALVESGVTVDKICTITFTKAAADEFFERFQRQLSARSIYTPGKGTKEEEDEKKLKAQRCLEALNNIDSCFLGTIDSFLSMLAHELPSEIKIPSDAVVIDEASRMDFVMKQYEEALRDNSHPLHQDAVRFDRTFYSSHECFYTGINLLDDKRGMEVVYNKSLVNADLDDLLKNEKNDFLHIAEILYKEDIVFKSAAKTDNYNKVKRTYPHVRGKSWNTCVGDISSMGSNIAKLDFNKDSITASELLTDGLIEEKIGKKGPTGSYIFTSDALKVVQTVMNTVDDYMHSLYFDFILKALHQVNQKLKEEGKFSYFDFLYYVTEAFKESAAGDRVLVNHVYSRHSYFLLDENQDTNPLQTQLFFYITGTVQTPDWTKSEPKEGSLFIVGDPKQSIYAFRGANVQAYNKTKSIFAAKNELLILTRNYRSLPSLRKWFNDAMEPLLNRGVDPLRHNDIEIDKEEFVAESSANKPAGASTFSGVYKYSIESDKEASYLAALINELVGKDKYQILVKNPDEDSDERYIYRPIEYKDFLIVPRNKKVNDYIEECNKYNIPLVVEAEIPFASSKSLTTLVDFAKLLKNPSNRIYFLNLLYSYYKFDDSDIAYLINNDYSFDLEDSNPYITLDKRYLDVIKSLKELYLATKNTGYSSTLTYVLNNKKLSLLKHVDSSSLEYTYFLIEKVKEKEENGTISSTPLFVSFVEQFIERNLDDNRVLRFQNKLNRVKIANLHKVKGLQAPIVILNKPRVWKTKITQFVDYSTYPAKVHYKSIDRASGFGYVVQTHAYDDTTLANWEAYNNAECDRLAYVAATRAESVLLISQSSDKPNASYVEPWEDLAKQVSDTFPALPLGDPDEDDPEKDQYEDVSINEKCSSHKYEYASPSTLGIHRMRSNEDVIDESKKEEDKSTDKENAAIEGTLVHKLLELIVSSKNGYKDRDKLVTSIINKYHVEEEDKSRDILNKVYDTFTNGGFKQKHSVLPDDLLPLLLKAEEVYTEMPFSYLDDKKIVNGTIDLLYKDDKGYHVIDYKSNRLDDVFLLEKHYESQLNQYKKALKEIGIDADAHIYHIDINK